MYIQEAHAADLWPDDLNRRDGILIRNPFTFAERRKVAASCVVDLKLEMPALVDGIGNPVEGLYTGWPDRLYVIGRDGWVAYKSAAGPYGFRPAEAESALRAACDLLQTG